MSDDVDGDRDCAEIYRLLVDAWDIPSELAYVVEHGIDENKIRYTAGDLRRLWNIIDRMIAYQQDLHSRIE